MRTSLIAGAAEKRFGLDAQLVARRPPTSQTPTQTQNLVRGLFESVGEQTLELFDDRPRQLVQAAWNCALRRSARAADAMNVNLNMSPGIATQELELQVRLPDAIAVHELLAERRRLCELKSASSAAAGSVHSIRVRPAATAEANSQSQPRRALPDADPNPYDAGAVCALLAHMCCSSSSLSSAPTQSQSQAEAGSPMQTQTHGASRFALGRMRAPGAGGNALEQLGTYCLSATLEIQYSHSYSHSYYM